MLKHLPPVFLIFVSAAVCFSQQPKITPGKPYDVVDGLHKFYFYKDNGILKVTRDERTIYIQRISTDDLSQMQKSVHREFPLGFESIKESNEKIYVFYSNRRGLHAREIDVNTADFKDEGKQIITATDAVANLPASTKDLLRKYDFYMSHDRSVMAVQYRFKPESKVDSKNYDVIGLDVFDRDLKQLWTKKITMPYTEKRMDILSYSVDSKANVYIVANIYEDDTRDDINQESGKPNYHLEIFKVTPQGDKVIPVRVELKDNFIKTIVMHENLIGEMTCIGYYTKIEKPNNVDGVVMFKLAADDKLDDFKTYEIPLAILNQYLNFDDAIKNNQNEMNSLAESRNLVLRGIRVDDDGSILLVGEEFHRFSQAVKSAVKAAADPIASILTSDRANNLLITKIDSLGNLAWMRKLPRKMLKTTIDGPTFIYVAGEKAHHFLVIDNKKNSLLPLDKPLTTVVGWSDIIVDYAINDATGDVKKTPVFDVRNIQGTEIYQFRPNRIAAIAPSTFVFEGYLGQGKDIMMKAVLPE
jgi:hypothetical protein